MIAQLRHSRVRQIDGEHSKLRIPVFLPDRLAKSFSEKNGLPIAQQGFHSDTGSEWFAVTVVIAPADFYIFRAGKIGTGRPMLRWDIGPLHGQTGVKRAMIDDVDRFPSRFRHYAALRGRAIAAGRRGRPERAVELAAAAAAALATAPDPPQTPDEEWSAALEDVLESARVWLGAGKYQATWDSAYNLNSEALLE